MKKYISIAYIMLLSFLLTACGAPTLDTSSEEDMKRSIQEMTKELSEKEKDKFQKALMGVYMTSALLYVGSDKSQEEIKEAINEQLDGKSVDEILELADEIKEKIKNRNS